jgi:hypothetical protein
MHVRRLLQSHMPRWSQEMLAQESTRVPVLPAL